MLVISALLAFNALLLWVATGPRSLDKITPYIENALSASDGSYHVKIGDTHFIWDGWRHPVDIRLKDVAVITGENKTFTVFPDIALGVDVLYLPLGRIMPTSLTISAPFINVVQNDDRSFGFGFKQQAEESAQTLPLSAVIVPFLNQDANSSFRRLRSIIIRDVALSVMNSKRENFFDARDFNITLNRDKHGKIKISTAASIYYKDYTSSLRAEFNLQPNHPVIEGIVEFSELMPNILVGLFSDNEDMRSLAVPVSGQASILLGLDGNMQNINFNIKGSKGNISSKYLTAPITLDYFSLQGAVSENFKAVEIKELSAAIEGSTISANAMIKLFDREQEKDATPEINAEITLKNAASGKINGLWPPSLSPMTREWVTSSISEGQVKEAKLLLNIKKGDLAKPLLPKEAIDANIDIEGLKVLYLPEHPPISNVNGKIHIDGVELAADIEAADYLEKTKLSKGHVLIEDLNADNPYIKVDLQADAPAKDMVHFLGLPRLKHKEHLGLREDEVQGNVKGEAKVGFNFFSPKGKKAEDAIVYDVKAEIDGISQKGFLNKFDIAGAKGTVTVNNKSVEFSGSGEINGAAVSKGNVKYLFEPEAGIDTFIDVVASTDVENLKRFGYPEFYFMKTGNLGVNAKVAIGSAIEKATATLNIDNADINFSDFGWKKPRGEQATIELTSEKTENLLKINSFNLNGKKIKAKGSLELANNFSTVSSLKFSDVAFAENNIQNFNYENNAGVIKLDIAAESMDATTWLESGGDGFSFKNFPSIAFKGEIGQLIVGKDRVTADFKAELDCNKLYCATANIFGETGAEKPYAIKIFKNAKNQREISVRSEDAGSFLYVFGIIEGMNGGELNLTGNYNDSGSGNELFGKLEISEHTIKNAPLLGKVLSLASLTGLIDTLQGNGIRFKELSIPFTLNDDVITIEKGKTYGSAIGITVDGTITFPKKFLDLQGTVVPSYSLNSVFGKVPLLGEMLTGGEGQGVFAARYSIKGVEDKAEVSVNPLSILTPGFLRGLFDIFDQPVKNDKNKKNNDKE